MRQFTVTQKETYNTLSNAIYLAVALSGVYERAQGITARGHHQQGKAKKYHPCFFAADLTAALVGLGSFLFHRSGLWVFQVADELPMSLLLFVYFMIQKQLYMVELERGAASAGSTSWISRKAKVAWSGMLVRAHNAVVASP